MNRDNVEEIVGMKIVQRAERLAREGKNHFGARSLAARLVAIAVLPTAEARRTFYLRTYRSVVGALGGLGIKAEVYERYDGASVGGGESPTQHFVHVLERGGVETGVDRRATDGAHPHLRVLVRPGEEEGQEPTSDAW